jgi:hypothetical protein
MKKKKRKETKARNVYRSKFRKKYGYTIEELTVLLDTSRATVQKFGYLGELQNEIDKMKG